MGISNFSASLPNIKTSLNLPTQMRKKDHLLHLDNKRCDFLKSFFVRITTLGLKTWKDFKALTCLSLGLPCTSSTSCLLFSCDSSLTLNIMFLTVKKQPIKV